MHECGICYETKPPKFFPCNHSVCNDCYNSLLGDNCPFCRTPFRQPTNNRLFDDDDDENLFNVEFWREYENNQDWSVLSRVLRSGTEIINVFRNNNVPQTWRNDSVARVTTTRRGRRLRRRLRAN